MPDMPLMPCCCPPAFGGVAGAAGIFGSTGAADVYMPVTGEITEVNEALRADPSLANTDPLNAGWFFKVKLANMAELTACMDCTSYTRLLR